MLHNILFCSEPLLFAQSAIFWHSTLRLCLGHIILCRVFLFCSKQLLFVLCHTIVICAIIVSCTIWFSSVLYFYVLHFIILCCVALFFHSTILSCLVFFSHFLCHYILLCAICFDLGYLLPYCLFISCSVSSYRALSFIIFTWATGCCCDSSYFAVKCLLFLPCRSVLGCFLLSYVIIIWLIIVRMVLRQFGLPWGIIFAGRHLLLSHVIFCSLVPLFFPLCFLVLFCAMRYRLVSCYNTLRHVVLFCGA